MPKIRKSQSNSKSKPKLKRLSIDESSRSRPNELLTEHQTESYDTISVNWVETPIYKPNLSIAVSLIGFLVHYTLMIVIIIYYRPDASNWYNIYLVL